MANQNLQRIPLTYPTRAAFEAATTGVTQPIMAHITADSGLPPFYGIKIGGQWHYHFNESAAVAALQAAVAALQNADADLQQQIWALMGQSNGPAHFGACRAPSSESSAGFPFTFVHNSNDGGTLFNELLYVEYLKEEQPEERTKIFIASSRVQTHPTLWIRTREGDPSKVDLYASEGDAGYESDRLASATLDGPGNFPFADETDGETVWGHYYNEFGHPPGEPAECAPAQNHFLVNEGRFFFPGARIRVPFKFRLGLGATTAPSISFSAWFNAGEFPFQILDNANFTLNNYGYEEAFFFGELIIEYLDIMSSSPPPYRKYRAWIELRGADPQTSPISPLSIPAPQDTLSNNSLGFISLGFRCDDEGGTPLESFELWSADAIFDPPPTNM